MTWFRTKGARGGLALAFVVLLSIAFVATREASAGQAAVPLSRPGQEDLSFWVNHNGLIQFDAEGEVGFGDMARILLRRRTNSQYIRELRDRFRTSFARSSPTVR
jgi:hypothetical protein